MPDFTKVLHTSTLVRSGALGVIGFHESCVGGHKRANRRAGEPRLTRLLRHLPHPAQLTFAGAEATLQPPASSRPSSSGGHAPRATASGARASSGDADQLRLFVALELPPAARDALVAFRDAAAEPSIWRAVAGDALHLTLAFLGRRPATDVAVVEPILRARAPRPKGAGAATTAVIRHMEGRVPGPAGLTRYSSRFGRVEPPVLR